MKLRGPAAIYNIQPTTRIHDLAGIVTPVFNASRTINNITSGFFAPGIYPFSRKKFTQNVFEGAEVTNRTDPLL